MSIYVFSKQPKQLNLPPEEKKILVPFAFKYWWTLVVYVELLITMQSIYTIFFEDAKETKFKVFLQVIGIFGK